MDNEIDLSSKVAAALLESSQIGMAVIEVEDQDGVITLTGETATEQDKQTVGDVAAQQEGVVKVINKMFSE
jgi:osmotically-inducible protein OsmY